MWSINPVVSRNSHSLWQQCKTIDCTKFSNTDRKKSYFEYLSAITAAPKPGISPTSGANMTRATAWMCRSEILGTMRVASPPAGSSIAMAILASPAHLNATYTPRHIASMRPGN